MSSKKYGTIKNSLINPTKTVNFQIFIFATTQVLQSRCKFSLLIAFAVNEISTTVSSDIFSRPSLGASKTAPTLSNFLINQWKVQRSQGHQYNPSEYSQGCWQYKNSSTAIASICSLSRQAKRKAWALRWKRSEQDSFCHVIKTDICHLLASLENFPVSAHKQKTAIV